MLMITDKMVYDLTIVKQSEFKKPYKSDDYQQMEYDWPDPSPGPTPPWPYPPPWPPGPIPPNVDPVIITKVFTCSYDICYCKGQKICGTISCTYPIVSISGTAFDAGEASFKGSNKRKICVSASNDAHGEIEFVVHMRAEDRGARGQKIYTNGYYQGHISECPERMCGCKCEGISIGYTTDTMKAGTSQTLTVVGYGENCTPADFTWSTTSGSLSAASGYAVTFTAPSSVPSDCAWSNLPVVTLSCKGVPVSSKGFGVYAASGPPSGVAAYKGCTRCQQTCGPGPTSPPELSCQGQGSWYKEAYYCDNSYSETTDNPSAGCWTFIASGGNCNNGSEPCCGKYGPNGNWCATNPCSGTPGVTDVRTSSMKTEGCCPAILGY